MCTRRHVWECFGQTEFLRLSHGFLGASQGVLLLLLLSRFSCVWLCWDPIDYSPPGSSVCGILQVRTLEWVAISFSNAWKWKVKVKTLSRLRLFATAWTAAYQAPPSMGFSRQEYWSGAPLPSRVTLLQSLIIYRTIHLINCFKSSHHFRWRLSHILGNTRNNNLVKQAKYKWYS